MRIEKNLSKIATKYMLDSLIAEIIPALIQVESGGDDGAVGDNGAAVGCLQIHRIYVDDVNRIIAHMDDEEYNAIYIHYFDYADRNFRMHSTEMAKIYLAHYGGMDRVAPTTRRDWLLKLAACHNAGPNGYKHINTDYVDKIEKELDK